MPKRFRHSLTALLLFLAQGASAQFAENVQVHGGVLLEFIPIQFPTGQDFFLNDQLFYGIVLGGEYTLLHNADVVALNLDANAVFSFNYSNLYGTQLFLQVPAYLVGKLGAGATPYSESVLGISAGVGLAYTFANIPYATDPAVVQVFRLKPSWLAPSAMAQITLNLNGARYALRGHFNLSTFSDTENDFDLRYENYGIGLIYNF